jgi:hypothetical protein
VRVRPAAQDVADVGDRVGDAHRAGEHAEERREHGARLPTRGFTPLSPPARRPALPGR